MKRHLDGNQSPEEGVIPVVGKIKLKTVEYCYILKALKKNNGNRTKTTKDLGISIKALRNKINRIYELNEKPVPPENYSEEMYKAYKSDVKYVWYGSERWKILKY